MFVNALFTALEHVRTRFHHLDHQIAQGHCPLMLACYCVLKNMSCSWTLVRTRNAGGMMCESCFLLVSLDLD